MKVLLTGGAGYIGSHTVVELYASKRHSAVIVDNLSNSTEKAVEAISKIVGKTIPFYETDCKNYSKLKRIFAKERPEVVIHFAGYKSVGESINNPCEYWDNNLNSTLTLLRVMSEMNCKKLIFSSSATVYGVPASLPLTEDSPVGIGLTNPYGETKYAIERVLRNTYDSDPNWSITVLRYFNPVGAHRSGLIGEDPKGIPNNLMPYIAQVAVGKRKRVKVFGDDYETPDGTGVRDYIHVVDLARGHVSALKSTTPAFRTYNLGTGAGTSVLEVLRAYETACGKTIPYKVVSRRIGDIPVVFADPKKANNQLRWRAKLSIEDACASSYKWQSSHPNGYGMKLKYIIYVNYVKRMLDVMCCLAAIPFAVLPMLVVAIMVKMTSPGPVIFKQSRVGRDNKPFVFYKFRSMYVNAPRYLSTYEFADADKYITRVGKFIRKTSLDELPQLFNVLKGDMSLVGPRPIVKAEDNRIRLRKQRGVDTVRPGLTGWAQINGRDLISETKKADLDAYYISRISFSFDLKIVMRTVKTFLNRNGNVEGNELRTAERVVGSGIKRAREHE